METTNKRLSSLELALERLVYQMENFVAENQAFKQELHEDQKRRDREMQEFKFQIWEDQKRREIEYKCWQQEYEKRIEEERKHKEREQEEYQKRKEEEQNRKEEEYRKNLEEYRKSREREQEEYQKRKEEEQKHEQKEYQKRIEEDQKRREAEALQFRANMNKQWGELANKMGTIVEDIIFPGIEPLLQRCFKIDVLQKGIRISKKKGTMRDEFDIIVETRDYIFMVEVKSSPNHNHVLDLEDKIVRFQHLFTEYQDKKLVPILASLTISDHVVNLCSKKGYYALAYRQWDYLDILNLDKIAFPPKE